MEEHNALFLQRLAEQVEPVKKLAFLEAAKPGEDADADLLESRLLWWHARYVFVDKKKTRLQDRFVWLYVFVSNWERGGFRDVKNLTKLCDELLGSGELTAALQKENRLYEELLDAASTFVETLRTGRPLLGLINLSGQTADKVNARVSSEVVYFCLEPLMRYCGEKPHVSLAIRSMFDAAKTRYPGIQPELLARIESVELEQCRALLLEAVQDPSSLGY